MERKISQGQFVGKVNEEISDNYVVEKVLGDGAFSVVYLAHHVHTGIKRCIKKISKKNFTQDQSESIMNEIKILKEIDHPNIIKIIEYYESKRSLYIVTEFLDGGELFDKIEQKKSFTEQEACIVVKQILSAVAYLHSHGIIHRDLKPENIIFENLGKDQLNLKLIDFGTSRKILENEKLSTRMGTPYYIAPEVLQKNYDRKCDVWSLGVIMYILFCGYPPFNGSTDEKIMKRIQNEGFSFPAEEWDQVSNEAKELISEMLQKNPEQRPSAVQLLEHSWFNLAKQKNQNLYQKEVINNLIQFRTKYKFQTAIRLYMMSYLDLKSEKLYFLEAFKSMDTNGDGQISKEELRQYLEKNTAKLSSADADRIISELDLNQSEYIDYSEFLLGMFDHRKHLNEDRITQMFKLIDANKDGFISESELATFFHIDKFQSELLKELMKEADSNGDNKISFEEFKTILMQKQFIYFYFN